MSENYMYLVSKNNKSISPGSPLDYNEDGNSFDGGGGNMNKKFVTHDELKISQLETQNKLIQLDNKTDTKFSELSSKIDSKFNILDNKIDK